MKNIRQLSRAWADTTRPILFETFRLRVNLDSYERLRGLSACTLCQELVKTIDYDGNIIDTLAAAYGFDRWLSCSAGGGMGLMPKDRDRFLEKLTDKKLQTCYQNYCQYGLGQDEMLRQGEAKRWLVEALSRFPAIHNMRYSVKTQRDRVIRDGVPSLDSLSSVAQKILAEPEGYHRYMNNEEQFWGLLDSLCKTGRSTHLHSIYGEGLELWRWSKIAGSLECHKRLPALRNLSLKFDFAQHGRDETTELSAMISHCLSLENLCLSFENFSFEDPTAVIHLPDIISDSAQLDCLGTLSLTAVNTTESGLRKLMQRLSKSLRSLELSTIAFGEASPADVHGKGSWILFITFLAEKMLLDHVRFSGSLTNGWDEAWVMQDAGDVEIGLDGMEQPRTFAEDCLKHQIERYVTRRGPTPFVAKTENDDYDYDYGCYSLDKLPWKINLDDSWWVEERLLA
ncbi:hypothetical protein PWT90_07310 [Aphanocladium album]|nr:hypothetical protein PWT90_07310 [Aphanocladium album]